MRRILLFIFSCIYCFSAYSQTAQIKGVLVDSVDKKDLTNALVTLIRNKDSVLIDFSRANTSGAFSLNVPDTGSYILMATHPYFSDFSESILVLSEPQISMGIINMLSKAKLLEEVVVRANRAMYLRGDTTIFTADSFKVEEGANVEELFKKLPGFQVDRNGNITAMGETVKKVLVDGEEFFGSDPGIATKNLRADVVQEVQVYDRGSDQANFTGIDDGVKDRTVNLKLKEDKKKGYFGKIDAGGGIRERSNSNDNAGKERFYGAAMLNSFKAKRKLAGYLISSNTGFMNLDWSDADKYGGGNGSESGVTDDGGIYIMYGGGDYNSSNGIPVNYNGGLHYSNKFNQDKNSLNTGYKYVRIEAPGNTKIFSRNFTPDSSWSAQSENQFKNISEKHSGNFTFETKLDSMNTLKLTAGVNFNTSQSNADYKIENLNDKDGSYINTNNRQSTSNNDQSAYNANLLWMHKFKKQYRTVSINANFNANESKSNGLLYSKLDFYKNNVVDSVNIIDQQTLVNNSSNTVGSKISYTEPLAKDFYMEASYTFSKTNRNNQRDVFAKNGSNGYNKLVDSLSNDYEFNEMSNTPGIGFRYSNKKLNVNIGTAIGFSTYEQLNKTIGNENNYNFANHFPRATFSYKLKPNEGFRFGYNGNTSAPSLDQLQPVRVNTDPLNQYIGNPDLRPSFSHRFNLGYNSWKMLSERGVFAGIDFSFTDNAFVQYSSISNAVRTYQTVNTNGVYNYNIYVWYNRKLRKANIDMALSPNFNFNQRVDFIGNATGVAVKNITKNSFYNLRLRASRDVENKYSLSLSPYFGYNIAKASVNALANAEYWTGGGNVYAKVYFPKSIELSSDVDIALRQRDTRFPTNNNFVLWNAELIKWVYKKEFQVKFAVRDILNQKNGYSRNFSSYSFTETYNTILRRHFLVGFVWNFNKMNAGGSTNSNSK